MTRGTAPVAVTPADAADGHLGRAVSIGLAIGLLAVFSAVATRLMIDAAAGPRPLPVLYLPAVFLASVLGGLWPGLAAVALSLGAMVALCSHFGGPALVDVVEIFAFALIGGAVAWSIERLHVSRREAVQRTREIAAREGHLASIIETVPDAMVVIDEAGTILSFSLAAEHLFGYDRAAAVGRNVSLLMPSPHSERHDDYISRYIRTGEKRIIGIGRVVVGKRADASTFPMELSIGEARVGGVRSFTGFIRDLTEVQETQARLQELQSELIRVSRLTSMGELVTALAHELNQPLSAIASYVGGARKLLSAGGPDAVATSLTALEKAGAQSLRAGEVIQHLREFVTHGTSDIEPTEVSRLFEEATALALIGLKRHDIELRISINPPDLVTLVDRVQIEQVIINLVRNAIDSMAESDRRELAITAERGADGDITVAVSDTGSGISPACRAKLFTPFFTTKSDGMGVGLSISRRIVEAHGGRIEALDRPGGGTIFSFTLPESGTAAVSHGD